MSRFLGIVIVLTLAGPPWGNGGGAARAEVPAGVIAELRTTDQSGFTGVAVAGDQVFLGTSRGGIWKWNPLNDVRIELRKAVPEGPAVLDLEWLGDDKLLVRSGGLLEIGNPAEEMRKVELPPLAMIAFSPTGRQMAGMTEEPPLLFFSTQTGKQTHRADRQVWVDELHYSPTGRFLATARFGRLYLWNSQTGELIWKARLEGNLQGFAFSPDESAIFAAAALEGIWVVDVKTGRVEGRFSRLNAIQEDKSQHRLAFSPDGRLLAETQFGHQIEIWETVTGRPVLSLAKHPGEIADLEFLEDGFRLVSADRAGRAYLWDLSHKSFAEPFDVTKPYSEKDQSKIWRMLGEPRGRMAWSAMIALWYQPEVALALIDDPPDDEELIRELIRHLDDDLYSVRQSAFRALKQLSLKAEPLLKAAIKRSDSAEVTARIRRLLVYVSGPSRQSQLEMLKESQNHRQLRLIQLLNWIGTPQAQQRAERLQRELIDSDGRRRSEAEQSSKGNSEINDLLVR